MVVGHWLLNVGVAEPVSRAWEAMSMMEGLLETVSVRQLDFIVLEVGYIKALRDMGGRG